MSQQNLELVLNALREFAANEPIDDLIHAEAFATAPDGWPERGPFEGKEAVMRQFERLRDDYSEHRFTDVEVIGEDEDWVVIKYRWNTRGSTSGIETSLDGASAYKIRDQRIAVVHFRWNTDDALEAAGLSE